MAAGASGGKITARYLPSSSPSDYAPNITTFINQKCGIIVTNGYLMGQATATAAMNRLEHELQRAAGPPGGGA